MGHETEKSGARTDLVAPTVGLGSSFYLLAPLLFLRIVSALVTGCTSPHCGLFVVFRATPAPQELPGYEPFYLCSTGNPPGPSCSLIRPVLGCVLIALCFHPKAREGILLINLGLSYFPSLLESASRPWAVREVVKQNLGEKELVV